LCITKYQIAIFSLYFLKLTKKSKKLFRLLLALFGAKKEMLTDFIYQDSKNKKLIAQNNTISESLIVDSFSLTTVNFRVILNIKSVSL
jgi:hypothetical protein